MKSLVAGFLLWQTLHAQILPPIDLADAFPITDAIPASQTAEALAAPPEEFPIDVAVAPPAPIDDPAAGLLNNPLGILADDASSSASVSESVSSEIASTSEASSAAEVATTSDTVVSETVSSTEAITIVDTATVSETVSAESSEISETTITIDDTTSTVVPSETIPTEISSTVTEELSEETSAPEEGDGSESLPIGWTGEDYGDYDGEDYDDDYYDDEEEECPSYCLKKDGYKSDHYDEANYDDYDDSYFKRLLARLRRRQGSGGFASFSWPSSKYKKEEECSDDIPEWLYEYSEKPPCKPKCPKSCYKSYPSKDYPSKDYPSKDYPSKDSYNKDDPYEDPYAPIDPYTTQPYDSSKTDEPYEDPYGGSSEEPAPTESDGSEPAPTDGSEPAPTDGSEPAPTDDTSTTTSTLTTFVTSVITVPAPGGGDAPAAVAVPTEGAAGSGGADWTGETLETVCPKQCDPFNPAVNKCDITSSCTTTGKGKYYCACRAGYRASAWNEKDFSKQFKFQGQPYVYTAQGVVCDTVCSDQTCTEVLERPLCQ